MILGRQPDGTMGLRISKSGFDAGANPPVPANLIFDSGWPALLPVHQKGTFTIGVTNTGQTVSASVAFPAMDGTTIPFFDVYIKSTDGKTYTGSIYGVNGNFEVNCPFYTERYSYNGGNPYTYLQIYCKNDSIGATYVVSAGDYNSNGITSNPFNMTIAYIIYKVSV